ncbi:agrin-like [Mya arenaria]|uniref:agrin-like n=1 Tax=Mya arenaria TaxID=6604 RepID=UPI0022E66E1B|nr:agrin-like [Mya arenaria]
MISFLVATVLLAAGVAHGQVLSCQSFVLSLDCTTYSAMQECGTNGITYANRCYFAKAQCNDSSLHILHDGPCTTAESSTTPSPGSGVDGETAVLDFFCTALSHRDCPTDVKQVCGSDNWTYVNYCEYDKQRCTHRDLHIQNFGACATTP